MFIIGILTSSDEKRGRPLHGLCVGQVGWDLLELANLVQMISDQVTGTQGRLLFAAVLRVKG